MDDPKPSLLQRIARLAGLPPRTLLAVLGAVALCAVLGAGYWAYTASVESRLLRADADALPGDVALMNFARPRGESVFRDNCEQCHGPTGKGDPALGVPNLTDKDWLYGSGRVSEIRQTVAYGIRSHDGRGRDLAEMPAFSRPVPYDKEKLLPLTPSDVNDVISFLLAGKASGRMQGESPADNAAAATRGGVIFRARGACWDCHGSDGLGDNAVGAPNLMDNVWLYGHGSRADIFRAIAGGYQGVCPAWSGRLSPGRILEASLYVYSLSRNGSSN